MIKLIRIIITIGFWLHAFAIPFLICSLCAFIIYSDYGNKLFAIVIWGIGITAGILLAEFIRRKYGLDNFFSKIYGHPEFEKEIKSDE